MNNSALSQLERNRKADHEEAFHSQERYRYWLSVQALDDMEKARLPFPVSEIDQKLDKHEKKLISLGDIYGETSIFTEKLLQKILDV